jgi:mono/diheme cytochrome c family protein
MLIRVVCNLVMFCAVFGLFTGLGAGQDKQSKPPVPESGAQLYKRYCAVCHANDGKGNGPPPAPSRFKESPPDLTTLAQRHNGEFPEAYVADVLRNGVKMPDYSPANMPTLMPDHGPAEMPVWGTAFSSMSKSDEAEVDLRITNLTDYLKSIQTK